MAGKKTDSDLAFDAFKEMYFDTANDVLRSTWHAFHVQFTFLATFLDCAQTCTSASDISPDLVAKIVSAIKDIRKELQRCARIIKYPMLSKVEILIPSFAQLNEKIKVLREEIGDAYCTNWSSCLSATQSASSLLCDPPAGHPLRFRVCSVLYLLTANSDISWSLKYQMQDLQRYLYNLKYFLTMSDSDYSIPMEEEDLIAHHGAVAIRATHLCCMCWAAKMDQNMENDVSVLVLDLKQKIDLAASPNFLEMMLKFVVNYEVQVVNLRRSYTISNECKRKFLNEFLHLPNTIVLYEELSLLLSCLTQMKEMQSNKESDRFSLEIKVVIRDAALFKNRECTTGEIDLAILFARIWFLKVAIFLVWPISIITRFPNILMCHQIKALQKGSRFLIERLRLPKETTENQILTFIEELPGQVESVYKSSDVEEIKANKVRDILYKFLVQVMLLKAKKQLQELPNKNTSLTFTLKCQMEMVHEGLVFVIASELNQQKEITEEKKQLLERIKVLAAGVIFLCNSCEADKAAEEAADEVSLKLCDLLDMLEILKAKLREIYLQLPRLNIPRTPVLHFVEFFTKSLRELLRNKPDSIACVTYQIEALCVDLESLISSIWDNKVQDVGILEQHDLYTRLNDAAYLAEYVIDSIVIERSIKWNHLLWLYHASEEIRFIRKQIKNVTQNVRIHNVVTISSRLTSQATGPSIDEVIVVLKDQEEVIINQVTRGSLVRNVVYVAGMAGIGKTTLANKVFHDPRVISHFHVRAWCSVSQEYRRRDSLLQILSYINKLNDDIVIKTDKDLEFMLYKQLKRNCYLIVMDDIWNTGAWNELQKSFPNDKNGSRILITSRLHSLVSEIQPGSDPHHLRLLSDKESWELLVMKAFHGKGCPEELLEVVEKISKNCKGLPLSVVAVAGLLERMANKPNQWKEIAETLSSLIVRDPQTRCKDILELSYSHLPDELKACFLYFGQFLNDKDIPVQNLTRMWIAEGFVQKTELMSLEHQAEHYLGDLIGRSLVLVAKRRSDGGIKACRLHDMLRELCLSRCKDENFSRLITSNDEPYSYFDDSVYGDDFDFFMPSNFQEYEECRLAIHVKRKHFVLSKPSGPYVRSLLFSASNDANTRHPYDISFIFDNFKLLKVLDLECINMGAYFPIGILTLVLLRYLAVSGDVDSIPSSIASLRNLRTFIVKGLKGRVLLPDTIWSMKKLRNLHVNDHVVFSLEDEEIGDFYILENLLSLSFPSLLCQKGTEKMIGRFPNLMKLKCIFYSKSQHCSTSSNQFPRLELLAKLESLKVVYYGKVVDAGKLNFPLSLKRLTLSNFRLPWYHISTIGSLPSLEVLKLVSKAFEGEMWEMEEGEFLKLKFLQLEDLSIKQWNASSDNLPELKQLVLRDCKHLEGVPIEFGDIPTLQMIQVQKCGHSVEESIRRIQEEQLESGNQDLKILIGRAD